MDHHTQFTDPAYDYRMYDRIWQRVSPELEPYPELRAEDAAPDAANGQLAPRGESGEAQLPGALPDPCCMGTQARESLGVLVGYLESELAERQCFLTLSRCVRHPQAAALFRTFAAEKGEAVQQLKAAYYLITGECYAPTVLVEPSPFRCLREVLRTAYHQEACSGFNYRRSADEATDPCLQKLFHTLSDQAFCRAEAVMSLLGRVLRK